MTSPKATKKKPPVAPELHFPEPTWEDPTTYFRGERGKVAPLSWACVFYLSPVDRNDEAAWFNADTLSVFISRDQDDAWVLSCRDAGIVLRKLQKTKTEEAQREAIEVVVQRLQQAFCTVVAQVHNLYPPETLKP